MWTFRLNRRIRNGGQSAVVVDGSLGSGRIENVALSSAHSKPHDSIFTGASCHVSLSKDVHDAN